jgi:hypothetical protein
MRLFSFCINYSTFPGGTFEDFGNGIAVDANGQAVIVGLTGALNFPLQNAFDATNRINGRNFRHFRRVERFTLCGRLGRNSELVKGKK